MKPLAWLVCASLALSPALAQAAEGFATANVNLRAGPDTSYPRIATVPAGTPMDIQGCTDGWEWCDVITLGTRGWVAGGYVQYEYQNQRVVVEDYGSRIGIPVISFVIGTYWGNHYRDRSFYRQRDYWYHRPVQRRPSPRPAQRAPSRTGNRPITKPGTSAPGSNHHLPSSPSPTSGNPHPGQGNRPATGASHNQGAHPSSGGGQPAAKHQPATQGNHANPKSRPTRASDEKHERDH